MLQLVPDLRERGPARVWLAVVVRMPLDVQVLAADGTEARAVGAAEDLRRQSEHERVARPGGEVKPVVVEVRRPQLVRTAGARRLILARRDLLLDDGLLQATKTGTVEPPDEAQLEDGAGARAGDGDLRRDLVGNREVALPGEPNRLELDLLLAPMLLARPKLDRAQVEDGHPARLAGASLGSSTAAGRRCRCRRRRP